MCVYITKFLHKMAKRRLLVDWKCLAGAAKKKRRLSLEDDADGIFQCPVGNCLHAGYKSQRGLRKHINSKHEWYLYFDEEPKFDRSQATIAPEKKLKTSTHKKPSFSIDTGCGADFNKWLSTPCGGGKAVKEARQVATRAMKFLMFSIGGTDDSVNANEEFIDCCIGSPSILMKFLDTIIEDWGLQPSGALAYMRAITDLVDFRKASGVTDDVLRSLAVTEVYIRRGKTNLGKQMKLDNARNLTMEALIARKSWATIEELQQVIPYHTPKYTYVLKKCTDGIEAPTVSDFTFANRYITAFLFLRVKCTRPMSIQFMTLDMVKLAGTNGGYIDQTQFKSKDQFHFDTLILSPDVMQVLNSYIEHIRPLQSPTCDYAIVSSAGTQFTAMGNALSLLVLQAIGKYYISPTRYRQIVETESSTKLNAKERNIISKDQKHANYTARRHYQKLDSRDIARDGKECMRKLVGPAAEDHTSVIAAAVKAISVPDLSTNAELSSCTEKVMEPDDTQTASDLPPISHFVPSTSPESCEKDNEHEETSKNELPKTCGIQIEPIDVESIIVQHDDQGDSVDKDALEVKKEEVESEKKSLRFTPEEDSFLRKGYVKYSKNPKVWAKILGDDDYKFHPSRGRDSLRVRATTLGISKKKKK